MFGLEHTPNPSASAAIYALCGVAALFATLIPMDNEKKPGRYIFRAGGNTQLIVSVTMVEPTKNKSNTYHGCPMGSSVSFMSSSTSIFQREYFGSPPNT